LSAAGFVLVSVNAMEAQDGPAAGGQACDDRKGALAALA
jgi:hypothetical protein